MSQNLDATAINQIHALISAQGVNEIISKIGADAVALPENFRIHDLEKFNLNRFRFRGALSTASIDDFTRYSKDLADEGTRCFIDADNMRAVSVLNLGGTVAKLAMRQPFVLFKGLTFQKLCLPGAFRPGDHHNKMLRPG
ncbi:DUF2303 family protein, partial [Escherichia coli]|uniref:DUF2303 family protein n=1 Tax=Escherichia coli TaxID=562 RepID=UPI0032E37F80